MAKKEIALIQYKYTNNGREILRVVFGGYYNKTFYREYEKLNKFLDY